MHIFKKHWIFIRARICESKLPHHRQQKVNPSVQDKLGPTIKVASTSQNLEFQMMKNRLSISNLFIFNKKDS